MDAFAAGYVQGCNRKCPCRVWSLCMRYVDLTARARRLRMNEMHSEIQQWYDACFDISWTAPDLYGSG